MWQMHAMHQIAKCGYRMVLDLQSCNERPREAALLFSCRLATRHLVPTGSMVFLGNDDSGGVTVQSVQSESRDQRLSPGNKLVASS